MRAILRLLPVIIVATNLLSCAQSVDRSAEEQRIRKGAEDFSAAAQSRDSSAIANFYAEDAKLMPPNTALVTGREGSRSFWGAMVLMPNFSLTIHTDSVMVAGSGDLALETGAYQLSMDAPGGHVTDTGKYATAYKKAGTEWKIIVDIFNSDLPPAAVAAADTVKAR
jgi:ketosteroid isomerase-like protein